MLIGYARVSTQDQKLELQRDALAKAGCEKIFEDKASGVKAARPGLTEAVAFMRPGDTLVIWKLSRLGRSLRQLIEAVQMLQDKGIELRSLHESIDTNTATGKLLFHIVAAFAQFERDNMIENTKAGLEAARVYLQPKNHQSQEKESQENPSKPLQPLDNEPQNLVGWLV